MFRGVTTATFIFAVICFCCCSAREKSPAATLLQTQIQQRGQTSDPPKVCTDHLAIQVYFLVQPREATYDNLLHRSWMTIQQMGFFQLFAAYFLAEPTYKDIKLAVGLIDDATSKTCTTQVTPLTNDIERIESDFMKVDLSPAATAPINTWGAIQEVALSLKARDEAKNFNASDRKLFNVIIAQTSSTDAFGSSSSSSSSNSSSERSCGEGPYPTAETVAATLKENNIHLGLLVTPFEMAHWKAQIDQAGIEAELSLYTLPPRDSVASLEDPPIPTVLVTADRWATELRRIVDNSACKSLDDAA